MFEILEKLRIIYGQKMCTMVTKISKHGGLRKKNRKGAEVTVPIQCVEKTIKEVKEKIISRK